MRSNSLSVQYVMYSGINMTSTGRINRDEVIEVYHKELMVLAMSGNLHGNVAVSSMCQSYT